jgi:oxygen-independent coproporphyrinogen III oxidase
MDPVQFDRPLIDRYNVSGPRYTSYPTVLQFKPDFDEASYRRVAAASNDAQPRRDLSLYFHLPFCARLCHYCACNKVITNKRGLAGPYLERVKTELARHAELYTPARKVAQLHWGGGTPTFISGDETRDLMAAIRQQFTLKDDSEGEYSIEIDPREVRDDTMAALREVGFNRMSVGIQDFEPIVQKAVNRIQSEDQTAAVIDEARCLGFRSVSVDLIYGLPFQTMASMRRTLDKVIALDPDRVSIYNYAHLPDRFPTQARLRIEDMPTPATKLDILKLCIDRFAAAGYAYIGMDHFAKKTDALYLAQENGTLYRNFQGYSTHADCDLIGVGVTSIGTVGGVFYQNHKTLDEYYAAIDAGGLAVEKGLDPDPEDRLRRAVIMQLICQFHIDYSAFNAAWNVDFARHFQFELQRLDDMARDGLLEKDSEALTVTPRGRLLIRNICMVFDRYLKPDLVRTDVGRIPYSRAI